ncbi:MAG: response regulator [Dehalococcoidia bacterium]|nr:response regulator [Dehalococcoidia bacterium]
MSHKAKILVVDDDPDIIGAVSAVLEAHDYLVVTASDGEQGLRRLKDERPDIMILDLLMPKMDGFAVCKELLDPRWSKYHVPILIFSSIKADAGNRRYELETGLALNADDYVEKPIDPHSLVERVQNLLARKTKT